MLFLTFLTAHHLLASFQPLCFPAKRAVVAIGESRFREGLLDLRSAADTDDDEMGAG